MNREDLQQILEQVRSGQITTDQALETFSSQTYHDLGFAKIDHGRQRRKGFPEVVYAPNKANDHLVEICRQHLSVHSKLLITRLSPEQFACLESHDFAGEINPRARTYAIGKPAQSQLQGKILILTAGTTDLNVAEEARETAELMGSRVELIADVGVAGLHRLLSHQEQIRSARVVVVVAGMDGALPSVIGGLVAVPVIAVPTSVGYGAAFGGIAPLLTMLNSCAPGVMVVNIDNGFGAGFAAAMINHPLQSKA